MSNVQNIDFRSEEYERFTGTKTFGSLDGLRAIAILAVVWHHAGGVVAGWNITARGSLGVDLFFTISGFLIVTLLLRERRRTGTISLRGFYIRRCLRIFPPYYLMLLTAGMVAVLNPVGVTAQVVWRDLPYALFFLSNLVPMHSLLAITWSLSVEEQFYAVAPTVEKYAGWTLPFLLPLAYVFVSLPPLGAFPTVSLPAFFRETTFGPILLGVILAHVLDSPRGFAWISRVGGWWFAPIIALGLLFAAASLVANVGFTGWPRLAVHWSILTLVASCVIRESNALAPLLSLWPIRRIGIVSYGIYLYHLLVMHFVINGFKAAGVTSGFATFAGTLLGTWAVAELSYHLFEVRFLRLKARFAPAVRPTPITARLPPERASAASERGGN